MGGLDDWLPEWDVRERHERAVAAPPERALAAALTAPPDRLVSALVRARGMRPATLDGFFEAHGFEVLERTATSYVVGAVGTPWRPRARLARFGAARPASVRIAADLRARAAAAGSILSTETRVAAVDAAARRRFRLYWLAIRPFSALIRRRWLRAAERAL